MKTITLNIDDDTAAKLNTIIASRGMSGNEDVVALAMYKILLAIGKDEQQVELKFKKPID